MKKQVDASSYTIPRDTTALGLLWVERVSRSEEEKDLVQWIESPTNTVPGDRAGASRVST